MSTIKRPCSVKTRPYGPNCGKPSSGWTNHMDPLCRDCFIQRRVIQNLLMMITGINNWGGLINRQRYLDGLMDEEEARFWHGFTTIRGVPTGDRR